MRRASVSEFPNDNPLLHDGAIWVLETPCGALQSIPPAPPPDGDATPVDDGAAAADANAGARPEQPVEVPDEARHRGFDETPVESMRLDQARCELPVEGARREQPVDETDDCPADAIALDDDDAPVAIPAPPPAAADPFDDFVRAMVSVAELEDQAAAEVLPRLLAPASIEDTVLGGGAMDALCAGGWLTRGEHELCASDRLSGLVRAWQNVLRTGDFSDCGESMLNEWGAELLAALLAAPQRAQALSYELRRRGVAAFGMVRLAA